MYPTTLSMAYDYLVNYQVDQQCQDTNDSGIAFYQDEDDQPSRGSGGDGRGRAVAVAEEVLVVEVAPHVVQVAEVLVVETAVEAKGILSPAGSI